jgi:PKHD-type hydroxylase
MLVQIENVLSADEVAETVKALGAAQWGDGRDTAGYLSARVKNNVQLPENHPLGRKLGEAILESLGRNPKFISAALPLKIVPPLFNRYEGGQTYGSHVDGALRPLPGTPMRVRTDLSATLFLSDPASYDGGELVVEDSFGPRQVKLAAGDMVLYPGTSIHHVTPVTRGTRLAAFFWIQSAVRDDPKRALLHDLDGVVQSLGGNEATHKEAVRLAGIYHNLLRFWADS